MSHFIQFFHKYGLLAMFLCILLEYACFPVSSEIVLPLSGALVAAEQIPLYQAIPLSVLAGLLGTSICFLIGKLGGPPALDKLMKRFPKTKKPIEASFEKFEQYGILAVGLGRVIPLCRTYIAFVAGATNQPYPRFVLASAVGITIWNTILISLGYILKDSWGLLAEYYNRYKKGFLLVIIVLLSISLVRSITKKRILGS